MFPGRRPSKARALRSSSKARSEFVCTHATLRFAFETVDEGLFNGSLLAIDEFHHVSADEDSRLGALLRTSCGAQMRTSWR